MRNKVFLIFLKNKGKHKLENEKYKRKTKQKEDKIVDIIELTDAHDMMNHFAVNDIVGIQSSKQQWNQHHQTRKIKNR